MPQVLIAVAAAYAFTAVPVALGLAAGSFGAALVGTLAASIIAYAGEALIGAVSGHPKSGPQTIRQPIASHKLIRGYFKVGGALTFAENPGQGGFWPFLPGVDTPPRDNENLYMLITVAAQASARGGPVYFDNHEVPLAADGEAIDPLDLPDGSKPKSYADQVRIFFGNGTVAGDAALQAWLSAHTGGWTADCKQDGRSKLGVHLIWDSSAFGNGIPNITQIIYGKRVYDPRDDGVDITTSNTATPSVFGTVAPHGLEPGDQVWIKAHAGAVGPDGRSVAMEYEVGTTPSSTSFTLLRFSQDLTLTTGGAGGTVTKMEWSDNPELGVMDLICDDTYGVGADYDTEIPEDLTIAGANICDEFVDRAPLSTTFTANAATNEITYDPDQPLGDIATLQKVMVSSSGALPTGLSASTVYFFVRTAAAPTGVLCTSLDDAKESPPDEVNFTTAGTGTLTITVVSTFRTATDAASGSFKNSLTLYSSVLRILTGTRIRFTTTGALPSPLAVATDYYAIFETDTRIRIAETLADARRNNYITITTVGSGTNLVQVLAEPRYTCNGLIDTESEPQSSIEGMLSSMAGLLVPSGSIFSIYPGSYRPPSVTLDESDLRGPIQLTTLKSTQESFNSVKGTFTDPFGDWQPADYPARRDLTYIAEDNNRTVWRDFPLNFTISTTAGQRLSKIALRRARRDLVPRLNCKFTAFQISAADSFYVDNAMWGWSGEVFEATAWTLTFPEDDNNIPTIGVDITGQQNDANIYAWTAAEEASTAPQTKTGLPNPFDVAPPTGLAVASGNANLYIRPDGTVMVRAHLTWTPPNDAFVTSGGYIDVAYKLSTSPNWLPVGPPVSGDAVEAYINDVQAGLSYDFAIRSENSIGAYSDTDHPWQAEALNVLIQGKTTAPSDIATLTVTQSGALVILAGSPIADHDVTAFEYRYGGSRDWSTMTFIEAPHARPSGEVFAASCTTASIPDGTWWFAVKARDTSGNYSINAAFAHANVTGGLIVVIADQEAPGWPNLNLDSGTDFLRHWTGVLVPDGTVLASAMSDADLWDQLDASPVGLAIYEIPAIDLGSDQAVTVFLSEFAVATGPGETGTTDCYAEIDYWVSAGSDPGTWAQFTAANIIARHIRVRIVMNIGTTVTPNQAPGVVSSLTVQVAEQPSIDQAGTATAGAGGSTVTFSPSFNATPSIIATAHGANVAWTTSRTKDDFVLHVGPDTSTDTGGTADWHARGQ